MIYGVSATYVCVCAFPAIPEQERLPVTKSIASGMGTQGKVLHKEELGVSETERMIRKRVEDKLQGRKKTPPPSKDHTPPQSKDRTPPSSPPAKVSCMLACDCGSLMG